MTRYLFTCISSALYASEATVDALLRELAYQARYLYLEGLVEPYPHLVDFSRNTCDMCMSPTLPFSRGLFWKSMAPGEHRL